LININYLFSKPILHAQHIIFLLSIAVYSTRKINLDRCKKINEKDNILFI